jgi:hypothetical protein
MKSSKIAVVPLLMLMALAGCGGSGGSGGSGSPGPPVVGPSVAGNNVLNITVNGSLCSDNPSYLNEPCVSVTICAPGTSNCQKINDILLDTGSSGLLIFNQAFTVPLTQVTSGSGLLAECIQFGDGSSAWGPVQMASVILGNEPAVQIPIQVINQGFGTPSNHCTSPNSTPHTSPSEANCNGILGVGLFVQDSGQYFSCSGATSGSPCAGTTTPNAHVSNPVAALPVDNNGVLVQLPPLPAGGAGSASGLLILGIGTQANNMPSGVTAYGADQRAEFTTTLNGIQYASFIDTGSNGLFFPSPSATQLPACPTPNAPWFCPPATTGFSATTTGASGSPSGIVSFLIGNADSLFSTSNQVFGELGGSAVNSFDWGLPFFFGRSVFIGINGTKSSLGTGPYWAY